MGNELTMYWYPKCSTCKKAKKYLDDHKIAVSTIDLKETPPNKELLQEWMRASGLPIKRFFNTSGVKYRELGLKDTVDGLSLEAAAALLATDGMLIKRPLLVRGKEVLAVGFKESVYDGMLEHG